MGGSCLACGKTGDSICAGCTMVWYCSRGCQKADWKSHKPHCVKPRDGEWSADYGGLRVAPNARLDEIVSRLVPPRFVPPPGGRDVDPDGSVHLAILVNDTVACQESFDADTLARMKTYLRSGADAFRSCVILKTPNDVAAAQLIWSKRKPGVAGVEAALRAMKGTFLPAPVWAMPQGGNVEALALLLEHSRKEMVAARINGYYAYLDATPIRPSFRVVSALYAALKGAQPTQQCYAARPAILELLLKAGADPRLPLITTLHPKKSRASKGSGPAQDDDGWAATPSLASAHAVSDAPSLAAVEAESALACMRLLVQYGADINGTGSIGQTCLHTAIELHMGQGPVTSSSHVTVKCVQLLLELGADPNLRFAAPSPARRPLDALALVVRSSPDQDAWAPVFWQVLQLLHKHGADFTPLPYYSNLGSDVPVATNYLTYLVTTANPCTYALLKFALEVARISPNSMTYRTAEKIPLLLSFCMATNLPAIWLLMKHGADPMLQDDEGWRAHSRLFDHFCSYEELKQDPHAKWLAPKDELEAVLIELEEYEMRWRARKGLPPLMDAFSVRREGPGSLSAANAAHADSMLANIRAKEAQIRQEVAAEMEMEAEAASAAGVATAAAPAGGAA